MSFRKASRTPTASTSPHRSKKIVMITLKLSRDRSRSNNFVVNIPKVPAILAGTLGVLIFFLRPTAFGEVLSFPISVAIVATSVSLLLLNIKNVQISTLGPITPQLTLFSFIVLYLSFRNISSGGSSADNAFKFFMISAAGITALAIVSCSKSTRGAFFDAFAIIVIISSVSLFITFILLALGAKPSAIRVFYFPYTYSGKGDILFPFTFSYNQATMWFGPTPRLSGLFREPGIFPAFACWAATYAHLRKWPAAISAICIAASAACLSSLGMPLALYTGALLALAKARVRMPIAFLILASLAVVAWPILYGIRDNVGIGSKIASNSVSFRERMYFLEIAFSAKNVVIGDGVASLYRANEGVSLIAQIRIYGLLYFLAVIFLYFISAKNTILFLYGLVPAIVTVLTSQPIATDVPLIVMFMSFTALNSDFPHSASHPPMSQSQGRTYV